MERGGYMETCTRLFLLRGILFMRRKLDTVIRNYGPFLGPLTKQEAEFHYTAGHTLRVLNVHDADGDRAIWASVGYHFVNVQERYLASKPMPKDMMVFDIWFVSEGEEGLRHP